MLLMPTVLGMGDPSYIPIVDAIARLAEHGPTVTPQTVRRWAKAGKVRSKRLRTGGQFLICVEDIDALLVDVAA